MITASPTTFLFCEQPLLAFTEVSSANFGFELYASGEYLRMLEEEWEE